MATNEPVMYRTANVEAVTWMLRRPDLRILVVGGILWCLDMTIAMRERATFY